MYKWNLINKTNKQNRTKDMEIKNKVTMIRGKGENNRGKKGKGQVKEHVCIKDPWTKTMRVEN